MHAGIILKGSTLWFIKSGEVDMQTRTWPRACRLLGRLLTRHQALPRTQKRVVLQAAQAHVVLEHGHQGAAKHCCAQVGPRWTPATVTVGVTRGAGATNGQYVGDWGPHTLAIIVDAMRRLYACRGLGWGTLGCLWS
jgi:hypothetical protein